MKFSLYSDGGARGNPGPAAYGVAIFDESGRLVEKFKKYLGELTNNQAEYEGVVAGLSKAAEFTASEIDFYLDSELVVKQLKGEYKIKNPGLQPLAAKVLALTNKFSRVNFHHVPREKNKLADQLVNEALDEAAANIAV
ncbi:MAG: ribonuclease HI family protein [Patescibacteria group bacterium]|nr:ribonuclease HI family protein [Patescibacteria group bacterium]